MTACGVVFAIAGGPIARFFTTDSSVAEIARRLLLVAAIFQTLDATTTVLRSALRAAKDVRVVAIIGIGVAWCCIPGAAYLLGRRAGYGAVGGWCGFILETTIAATLFAWRWKRGSWRLAFMADSKAQAKGELAQVSPGSAVVPV
jgi:MATE family multidrug resistance protein